MSLEDLLPMSSGHTLSTGCSQNKLHVTAKPSHRGIGCFNRARPGLWGRGRVTGRSTQTIDPIG